MSNQLTLNTASLEELKARVNALPEPEIMQDGKTATPTEATQTIVPDSGFGGLSSVTVNPIPEEYENITIPLADLNTANGGTSAPTMAAAVDNTEVLVSDENTLIEQAIAALEGKSGSGSSGTAIETCTLILSVDADARLLTYGYSYLADDGKVSAAYVDSESYFSDIEITLENVICGSFLKLSASGASLSIVFTENMETLHPNHIATGEFRTPTINGSTGILTIIGDD